MATASEPALRGRHRRNQFCRSLNTPLEWGGTPRVQDSQQGGSPGTLKEGIPGLGIRPPTAGLWAGQLATLSLRFLKTDIGVRSIRFAGSVSFPV